MQIRYTDGRDSDFQSLCNALDQFLNALVGGAEHRSQYLAHNTLEDIHDVLIAYDGDVPVGCVSFQHFARGVAEVKRVFVREANRGKGVARELMLLLEQLARKKGYSILIVETGAPLVAAMRLYQSLGYRVIANYGPYKQMKDSICLEKEL